MSASEITYQDLLRARTQLLQVIRNSLTENERKFLLSIKSADPYWRLIEIDGIENFPAIKWKLLNIRKMEKLKQEQMIGSLKRILEL